MITGMLCVNEHERVLRKAAPAESHMCNEDQPTTKPPLNSTSLELRPEGKHEKKKTKKAALHTRGVNHSGSCLRSVFTASPEDGRPGGRLEPQPAGRVCCCWKFTRQSFPETTLPPAHEYLSSAHNSAMMRSSSAESAEASCLKKRI